MRSVQSGTPRSTDEIRLGLCTRTSSVVSLRRCTSVHKPTDLRWDNDKHTTHYRTLRDHDRPCRVAHQIVCCLSRACIGRHAKAQGYDLPGPSAFSGLDLRCLDEQLVELCTGQAKDQSELLDDHCVAADLSSVLPSCEEQYANAKRKPMFHDGQFNIHPSHRVKLSDLSDKGCRWPYGEPGKPGFHFCCFDKEPGTAYCCAHLVRSIDLKGQ